MAVETFLKYCKENNINVEVEHNTQTTKTAQEAADAHGVPVCNIVKSLLVKTNVGFILFLVPGDKKIDFYYLKETFGYTQAKMASPEEVKEHTGYSIGGVPPFGHKQQIPTYIYPGFDENSGLYAAAGFHNANFGLTLEELRNYINSV